jgi:hypothetical protein
VTAKGQIEAWALAVAERVASGQPVEDARVEIKAEWPDPTAAARRIAGHANAARGEQILWVVGLDERRGGVGAAPNELASWWQRVASEFEGLAPTVVELIVPIPDGPSVVALVFDTDRAPFVVRNPVFGKTGGGPVELEVPWREQTAVRSARRSDLLRMLVRQVACPLVECLSARLAVITRPGGDYGTLSLDADLYITPTTVERIVVPYHTYELSLLGETGDLILELKSFDVVPPYHFVHGDPSRSRASRSRTVDLTDSEIIVDGPGALDIHASQRAEVESLQDRARMVMDFHMTPVRADRTISVRQELIRVSPDPTEIICWTHDGVQ